MAFADLPGITDPQDAAFRADFLALLPQFTAGRSDAEIADAIQRSTWYGKLGSGSNAYAAAYEVGALAGNPVTYNETDSQWWNNLAVGRSPEGVARAQKKGGLGDFGTVLTLGGIALGGAGLLELATAEAGATAVGGEALGSEFGVQGDLAGVLTSGGAGDVTIGSEFGVQGDLAKTLATSTTGASSVASNGITAAQALKAASDAGSVVSGVTKLASTAAALQGLRQATAAGNVPIDFSRLSSPAPTLPAGFLSAGAPSSTASSTSSIPWALIGVGVIVLLAVVSHGG